MNCLAGRPPVALLLMKADQLNGHVDALLLAALRDGPRHGNAVMEALRASTGGRRRCYALTGAGEDALCRRRAGKRDFAAVMGAALEGTPWPNPS